jgi:hypothetical protein
MKNDSRYFYDVNRKETIYNHASRHCAGCGMNRSVGQYDGDSICCKRCVARGITTPKRKETK